MKNASESITDIITSTLCSAVETVLMRGDGTIAPEFERVVYVRDISGSPGCMMGDVVIDCVGVDANDLACTMRDIWNDIERDDDTECAIEVFGARIIVREASAYETAQWIGDLLTDENWARICYVGSVQ